jgi:hypothetical protein
LKSNEEICKLTVDDTNKFHFDELKWLKLEISEATKKREIIVVFTHHAPIAEGIISPKHEKSNLNSAFCSYLNSILGGNVVLWCFGHTHFSSDQLVNGFLVNSKPIRN